MSKRKKETVKHFTLNEIIQKYPITKKLIRDCFPQPKNVMVRNRKGFRWYIQVWPEDVVEAAIHFMKENIERKITLQDILQYVGYSSTRFSALFKQQTGVSPLAYFNNMKIKLACTMMRKTDLHINQICYKLGIEDALYFSRMFSKAMGMSPSEYRKQLPSS